VNFRRVGYYWRIQSQPRKLFKFDRIMGDRGLFLDLHSPGFLYPPSMPPAFPSLIIVHSQALLPNRCLRSRREAFYSHPPASPTTSRKALLRLEVWRSPNALLEIFCQSNARHGHEINPRFYSHSNAGISCTFQRAIRLPPRSNPKPRLIFSIAIGKRIDWQDANPVRKGFRRHGRQSISIEDVR
jgi:hypothetical protein